MTVGAKSTFNRDNDTRNTRKVSNMKAWEGGEALAVTLKILFGKTQIPIQFSHPICEWPSHEKGHFRHNKVSIDTPTELHSLI